MNGWIKLHRKILDNPIARKPNYLALWVTLLLKANHEDKKMIWNDGIIVIKEGQFITGRKQLSEETGISETTIERILDLLEKTDQIGQQKTTKYRLITVVNWKTYQEADNKRTTSGQQADTNKKLKKYKKNTSEQSSLGETLIPEVIKLFEGVNPACKRMYGNVTQRKACQDLLDTYGFEEVSKVIAFLPKSNTMSYMPMITTPLQLWDKYQALKDGAIKKRSEIISNKQPNYIL